jgi:NADH-quinone oxidoreductase B subunit
MINIQNIFSLNEIKKLTESGSLWFYSSGSACCANELVQTQSCKYDLERLGVVEKLTPEQADLLIVYGAVTKKAAPALKEIYNKMRAPKRVIAIGACACNSKGLFSSEPSFLFDIEELFNVDVYVPGCPPRPEAIMHGIMQLKEKILNEN